MNQRKNSSKGEDMVALSRAILILFVLMICRSVFSQDLVFTAAPHARWGPIGSSGDGTKLAAFAPDVFVPGLPGMLYVSSDSGATWRNPNSQIRCCNFLALTPDATTLVAVCSGNASYTSHDLGFNWVMNALPGPHVQPIALSDDGAKWVCSDTSAGGFSGPIYISDDSGASWKATSAPVTNWSSVVSSADGSHLAAVYGKSEVFTSPDRGVTWESKVPAGPTNSFNLVISSADGSKLVAIGDLVCLSTNAGANWSTVSSGPPADPNSSYSGPLPPPLYMVSASADASSLVGFRPNASSIWTSTNSGAQWTLHNVAAPASSLLGIASSADGSRWLASGYALLYTWPPTPVALSFSSQGTNLTLSWPSNQIGFALESTAFLSPGATWSAVTNDVVLGNYRFNVTSSPGTPSAYYRLHKP